MEKISNEYIPEVEGAILHFSARGLPVGPMQTWYDLISGTPWSALTYQASPTVETDSQTSPVVRFDGVDDMITMPLVLDQPHTVVVMGAYGEVAASTYLHSGASGPSTNFSTNSLANGYVFSAGQGLSLPGVTPDNKIHVFTTVANGANSVIAVDGAERVGDAGPNGRTFLRIGYGATTYKKFSIYEVVVLPFAANAAKRQEIRDLFAESYGPAYGF